jgi:hypothetical protein
VAVSATLLTAVDDGPLSWLRAYCPTGVLGGSILVYDFTTAPSHAPGPAKPASVCSGRVSHRTG